MKGGGADDAVNVFLAEIALVRVKHAFLQTCGTKKYSQLMLFAVKLYL